MYHWLCPVFAFLLGSVPTGLLLARARGVNIRSQGSGNIGATNVLRVMGKKYGYLCLALDMLKGFVPVALALSVFWIAGKDSRLSLEFLRNLTGATEPTPRAEAQLLHVITGLCAVLGHNFSPWLGFRGGKGIATSAGVLLGLYPFFGVCLILVVWAVLFFTTRYVSVASMGAAVALPVLTHLGARFHHLDNDPAQPTLWQAGQWNKPLFALAVLIAVMAVFKHRSNIGRLIEGTENRFQRRRKTGS